MNLYRISFELNNNGNHFPDEWLGAFLNIYLTSKDLESAIEKSKAYLLENNYEIYNLYSANQMFKDELDENQFNEDDIPLADLVTLEKEGGLYCGTLFGYENDE